MKNKKHSGEKLNKKEYLKRVIIVSWIGLAVCFLIKLFGGNLFEIASSNENFIAICNYADQHIWLNYILSCLYCFASLYFFTLAILQRTKYKWWELIIVIVTVLGGTAIKVFWNEIAGLIFDIWQLLIMPIIFLGKDFKKYFNIFIAIILLFSFQVISMYIKNMEFGILDGNSFVGMIYSLDVLIMIVLFFAYQNISVKDNNIKENKEKENENNG